MKDILSEAVVNEYSEQLVRQAMKGAHVLQRKVSNQYLVHPRLVDNLFYWVEPVSGRLAAR